MDAEKLDVEIVTCDWCEGRGKIKRFNTVKALLDDLHGEHPDHDFDDSAPNAKELDADVGIPDKEITPNTELEMVGQASALYWVLGLIAQAKKGGE